MKFDVVILSGGQGIRLQSVLPDTTKVLAPVCGRPFLAYLFDQLKETQAKSVILATGYRGDQIHSLFGDVYNGMNLIYSGEKSALGTAGALKRAEPLLQTDWILVMNGDSYCPFEMNSFLDWAWKDRPAASMVVCRTPDPSRFGQVEWDEAGNIIRFSEKSNVRTSGHINAGYYLFRRTLLADIPADRPCSLEYELFPKWTDGRLRAYPVDGPLTDIGTPESYHAACGYFSKRAAR